MLGIETLDVTIGIITIYLIFALACTAIVEAISTWFNVRSNNLEAALKELLHGEIAPGAGFVDAFFKHPIVQSLSKGEDGRPSYISPEIVGQVITNLICAKDEASSLAQALNKLPGTTETNRIKGLLGSLHSESKEDIAAFRKLIEAHYDATMDRASGWYKRHTQILALTISAALVIGANVDTISLVNTLSSNPEARAKLIELAQRELGAAKDAEAKIEQPNKEGIKPPETQPKVEASISKANAQGATGADSNPPDPVMEAKERSQKAAEVLAKANADLSSAGIQLGWHGNYPKNPCEFFSEITEHPENFLSKLIGLLISILAISLGAPFWFDTLNRVMQIRAAGISPREKDPAVSGGTTKKQST